MISLVDSDTVAFPGEVYNGRRLRRRLQIRKEQDATIYLGSGRIF
jgi:hypothetical protein